MFRACGTHNATDDSFLFTRILKNVISINKNHFSNIQLKLFQILHIGSEIEVKFLLKSLKSANLGVRKLNTEKSTHLHQNSE